MREFTWGYFSEMAAKECGFCVYETLDGTGEVAITCVSREDSIQSTYLWPDTTPVGPVGKFLRSGPKHKHHPG